MGGDHVFLDACDPRHLACGILDVCKPFDESKVLLRGFPVPTSRQRFDVWGRLGRCVFNFSEDQIQV